MCSAGEVYVSTVEGRRYPFFATQWHPEKPPYEFSDNTIPHTRTAIDAAYATASLFVDVARLNSVSIPYHQQVKIVIENFDRHFIAAEDPLDEDEPLPDTLWFVPKPKHERKDPEEPPRPYDRAAVVVVVVEERQSEAPLIRKFGMKGDLGAAVFTQA